ncbi:hypothetical protein BB347_12670 [Natronorubrum daqingense]|nr:hypothetical protein BB347_12670 [Natronorubrum daqingense]
MVICIVLVFSVVYPLSTSEPHALQPADERFSSDMPDEFSVEAEIDHDGDQQLGVEATVIDDDARQQVVDETDTRTERYQSAPDDDVYLRSELSGWTDEQVDTRLEAIESDDERTLLVEEHGDESTTIVVRDESDTDLKDEISGATSVVTESLHPSDYEHVAETANRSTYEPRDGWVDEADAYRITDSSGEVTVDPDSYAVQAANVTWDVTPSTETYAHYLVSQLTSDYPLTQDIRYEMRSDTAEIETPDWVAEVRDEH